ncbi:helix-turn-helix domain-containing protein [Lelliottia nimipressuralis]|uniref:Helix-turn-helix domain-containing protein n=1 Tax=Lelliottia nimipressuralis TaxID=69220 RepID=A0ABD4KI07_9ENTR|nr:helix-turn-helix domain-containing protein [Lelliottia nimipressuralis]MBF4180641.1 helix-turn-helix domain-containing protein [Lelliottia nimipressuralis]
MDNRTALFNNLHSYSFAQETKPLAAVENLISKLIAYSEEFTLSVGTTYNFSQNLEMAGIVLLQEGIVSLCHTESGLHISTIFSPSVLGLVDGYSLFYGVESRPNHNIIAETECKCRCVPIETFLKVADELKLWHDVARVLAHRLMLMSIREQELVGVDSYIKVRHLLRELWLYPEELRDTINILSFVMNRTGLSRSRTLAILADLKKGKYIEIKSGKIVMLKNLPLAY